MKLKVGDRIRFIGISPKKYVGKVGIICEVRPSGRQYPYRIKLPGAFAYPVLKYEIEKVAVKNQQLLFSFMER